MLPSASFCQTPSTDIFLDRARLNFKTTQNIRKKHSSVCFAVFAFQWQKEDKTFWIEWKRLFSEFNMVLISGL
jgi:hypothetical protein